MAPPPAPDHPDNIGQDIAALHWEINIPLLVDTYNQGEGGKARKNAWILEYMWRLVNTRFSTRRDNAQNQGILLRLGR